MGDPFLPVYLSFLYKAISVRNFITYCQVADAERNAPHFPISPIIVNSKLDLHVRIGKDVYE